MKVAALLLCVAGLTAATETLTSWKLFKARYGRQYESLVEENYRYGIFKKNEERVNNHNLKHERGEVTFTMAMNQFGDMTNEEFNTKMKGYQRQPHLEHVSVLAAGGYLPRTTDLDWREKGAVTPVKNQLQCGSCWAFSTTGSLEGQHFIKKGKLVSLSEQQLVDCSGDYGNFGCGGGNMDSAFQYIKDNKGIDTECSYSYEAKNGHCRFNKTSVAATVTGYVNLEQDNETALLIAVSEVGPISVAIDASHPSFQLYDGGVYYEPKCSPTMLDHGVLVVGYGTSSSGEEYWLVKNSWGETWGKSGYLMMARNRNNNCGIATQASYPTV